MKSNSYKLSVLLLLCAAILLYGCLRVWYFKIVNTDNPQYPQMEFSMSKVFSWKGVGFAILDFSEVNTNNEIIQRMWDIEAVENTDIKTLAYGQSPNGYRELYPAKPLEIDKIYSVHGQYFFRIVEKQSRYIAEVYNFEEFYDKIKSVTKASDN